MTVQIPPIRADDLRADATLDGGAVCVRLAGSADTESIKPLEAMLDRVHAAALQARAGEVVVDLRDCGFINSSCLKSFVVWLNRIQDLEVGQQYRIRFLSDDSKPWQRRSLGTLSCFAVDLVRVEANPRVRT
jgi:hypothetical protein